jgi:hypothetical protein
VKTQFQRLKRLLLDKCPTVASSIQKIGTEQNGLGCKEREKKKKKKKLRYKEFEV